MFEKGLLAGKRILVTGGGSGLGAAMGHRFVELGAELIICGRRLELLEATAARMRSELGGKVGVICCDIRDGAAVDAMMEQIWREAPMSSTWQAYPGVLLRRRRRDAICTETPPEGGG